MSGGSVARWFIAACLALGAAGAGCSTLTDVAIETDAHDLSCPKEQWRYLTIGCGRFMKYECFRVGTANYKCVPDQPAQPRDARELKDRTPS